MSKKISDQAILDLGLQLFNEGQIIPQREPVSFAGGADLGPDLSKIDLSNDDIAAMLQGKLVNKLVNKKPETISETKSAKPKSVQTQPENRDLEQVLSEFTEVVHKAVMLLQEMTTCGMIGVNQAKQKKLVKKPVVKKKRTLSDIVKEYNK